VKVHLGCGKRYIPGFVHVDLADFPHIDHRHDVRHLPFFKSESANLIYACHVLEYFDRFEAFPILKEWRRVLRPGGILRVAVPDIRSLITIYERTGDLKQILGPLCGRMEVAGSSSPTFIYHRTAYDFDLLREVLTDAGFDQVRLYDWRQTEHSGIDDFSQAYYPHLQKESGLLISLNVEAVR